MDLFLLNEKFARDSQNRGNYISLVLSLDILLYKALEILKIGKSLITDSCFSEPRKPFLDIRPDLGFNGGSFSFIENLIEWKLDR